MFFFYASSWLAEHAADWLIVQGGYYMAAIAMRSSPIILFGRNHQESPHPSSFFFPSLSFHPFTSLPFSSCPPPLRKHTRVRAHTQSGVNRAPPALSEQMGAVEGSRLVPLAPHTFSLTFSLSFLPLTGSEPRLTILLFPTFVPADNRERMSTERLSTCLVGNYGVCVGGF